MGDPEHSRGRRASEASFSSPAEPDGPCSQKQCSGEPQTGAPLPAAFPQGEREPGGQRNEMHAHFLRSGSTSAPVRSTVGGLPALSFQASLFQRRAGKEVGKSLKLPLSVSPGHGGHSGGDTGSSFVGHQKCVEGRKVPSFRMDQ